MANLTRDLFRGVLLQEDLSIDFCFVSNRDSSSSGIVVSRLVKMRGGGNSKLPELGLRMGESFGVAMTIS